MFQSSVTAHLLRGKIQPGPLRMLEIGSGDGSFMLSVARQLARSDGVELVLVDKAELVTEHRGEEFLALGWRVEAIAADIFEWFTRPNAGPFDLICTNLFLHHFADPDLKRIFIALASRAPLFVATEPQRNLAALWSASLLPFIGANSITRHDASASVRAGFKGAELAALWPNADQYCLEEHSIGPFTHIFVAEKTAREAVG